MKTNLICFTSFVFLLFCVSESYQDVTVTGDPDPDLLSFNPSYQVSQSGFRPLNYEQSYSYGEETNRRQLSNPFEYHPQQTNQQRPPLPEGSRLSNPFEFQRPAKGGVDYRQSKQNFL